MTQSLTQLFDFFLPRFCAGCNNKLSTIENSICTECLVSIKPADKEKLEYEFDRNFRTPELISDFISLYIFEKEKALQNVLHNIKYNKKFLVGKFLGEKLAENFKDTFKKWNLDLIIPVPLHHLRIADRGFNQSDYIAIGISKVTSIKKDNLIIKRVRFTESQTLLNPLERKLNMENAFKVRNKKKIEQKTILLVDDIITTGATIKECAKVLLLNGAKKVYACSVAITD